MENLDIIEEVQLEDTQREKKKRIPTKVIFISIVILGVLGMICFLFAFIMGNTGVYHGASLDVVKTNFYNSQYVWAYSPVLDKIRSEANKDIIEEYFVDSNLVGVHVFDGYYGLDSYKTIATYGNISQEDTVYYSKHIYLPNSNNYYNVNIYILKDAPYIDSYHYQNKLIEFIYYNKISIWLIGIIIGGLIIVFYIDLIKSTDTDKMWSLCNIPLEINCFFALLFGAFLCYLAIGSFVASYRPSQNLEYLYYLLHLLAIALAEVVFLTLTMDITKRLKSKTITKTSLIGMSFKAGVTIFNNVGVLSKYILLYFVTLLIALFVILAFRSSLVFVFILLNLIVFPLFMFFILNLVIIIKASEEISKGDYNYTIKDKFMFFGFKELSANLNNISKGMDVALQEKIKSEMLKTELITNVSHDIKTPLTSIINYSDLICKEDCDNDKINEYSEVLYRQSNKLKKLIEDLIHASKASSGNIDVDLEELELNVFMEQVIGEYKDKFEEKSLELIVKKTDEIYILTDGKLLFRVFDNLFENIYKYALENSRVYLNIEQNEYIEITIKNISKYQLNISHDVLTERFIRGDSSRHSDGSGLGLSIAKSLVTSLNGEFDITIDGDLFKVSIKLK